MKIIIWILSSIISGFFILSTLGWFMAAHLTISGKLGPKMTEFFIGLNIFDHIVRISQVLLIVVASVTLLFLKRVSKKLFGIGLLISTLSFLFIGKWGITFLSPLLLVIVYIYVYWLNRRGFLR